MYKSPCETRVQGSELTAEKHRQRNARFQMGSHLVIPITRILGDTAVASNCQLLGSVSGARARRASIKAAWISARVLRLIFTKAAIDHICMYNMRSPIHHLKSRRPMKSVRNDGRRSDPL